MKAGPMMALPVPLGSTVMLPLLTETICEITGLVKVLLVSVSVVALPTNVSVDVGNVNAPVFEIEDITGDVKVLFVNVCEPVSVVTVLSIAMEILSASVLDTVIPVPLANFTLSVDASDPVNLKLVPPVAVSADIEYVVLVSVPVMVMVSVVLLVVMAMLLPPTSVRVSVVVSATTLD